jgi:predicted dehydrogenase
MTAIAHATHSPSWSRRGFLGSVTLGAAGATGIPAAIQPSIQPLIHSPSSAAELRVGIIGCGGRGTGAGIQAARASRGVRITCLADLFADHLDTSAAFLTRDAGPQFTCPASRRFTGADAWQRLLDSDVDVVVLATHPAARPAALAAAIAAGKHVYCEAPAAVDLAGVGLVAAALAEADRRGLVVVGGLASRHDDRLAAFIRDLHAEGGLARHSDGGLARHAEEAGIGRPLHAVAVQHLGLPWFRPTPAHGGSAADNDLRNWIAAPALSGGPLVERHVHAIDRGLWALGDDCPVAALPLEVPALAVGGAAAVDRAAVDRVGARFVFADGRTLDALITRGPEVHSSHPNLRAEETIQGLHGRVDLRSVAALSPLGRPPLQVAMDRLIGMIERSGPREPSPSAAALLRSTLAAVLGRTAAETGRPVDWPAEYARPLRPV